jgi:hypothetical protein
MTAARTSRPKAWPLLRTAVAATRLIDRAFPPGNLQEQIPDVAAVASAAPARRDPGPAEPEPDTRVIGPSRPGPAPVMPAGYEGLEVTEIRLRPAWDPPEPQWWWAGCHGGAGVSTLMQVIDGGRDADRSWPASGASQSHVVLVARTHHHGLRMAQAAARQFASKKVPPTVCLLGLVLVPDSAGRLPRALADLAGLISGGVPRTWELGWHEQFRLGVFSGQDGSVPPDYRRLADDLSAIVAGGKRA